MFRAASESVLCDAVMTDACIQVYFLSLLFPSHPVLLSRSNLFCFSRNIPGIDQHIVTPVTQYVTCTVDPAYQYVSCCLILFHVPLYGNCIIYLSSPLFLAALIFPSLGSPSSVTVVGLRFSQFNQRWSLHFCFLFSLLFGGSC